MTFAGPSDFIAAMARGDFDSVIDEAEEAWLEFKSQPYLPWTDEAKRLEFAKDASAMANGGGGLIVFGYRTAADPLTARDVVKARTPVATNLVDIDSYKQVLESWTYPPMRTINMRWWRTKQGKGKGILTIEVPPAVEAEQPILVLRASIEGVKRSILLGYYTRAEERVSETTAGEIHADIQLGRILRRVGIGGLSPGPSAPSGPTDDQRRQRLDTDVAEGGFGGRPRYYLQAWPRSEVEVEGILAQGIGTLRQQMSRPEEVRQFGFGLRSGKQPTAMPGGGLKTVVDRHSLSIERSGLMTLVAAVDSSYLTWAEDQRGRKNGVHGLALVECTLEFFRLYCQSVLPRCRPPVDEWGVAGGMADLVTGENPTSLHEGPMQSFLPIYDWHPVLRPSFEVGPYAIRGETPGRVACRVLRDVYAEFGLDESAIPYTRDGEIDEERIRTIRS